jgi:hypothetical protein
MRQANERGSKMSKDIEGARRRKSPHRYGYRAGSAPPADDFLKAVTKCIEDMLRTLDAWGYRWDADTEVWTGPGLTSLNPESGARSEMA